jgi:hypothetical protein
MQNPNDSHGPLPRRLAAAAFVLATVGWSIERLPMLNEAIDTARAGCRLIGNLASALGSVTGACIGFALMVVGGALISRWRQYPTDNTTRMALTASAVLVMAAGTTLAIDSTPGMISGRMSPPAPRDRRGDSPRCRSRKDAPAARRNAGAPASRPCACVSTRAQKAANHRGTCRRRWRTWGTSASSAR